jgi:hypothetical protein
MPSRRRLLAAGALALVGGAGCLGDVSGTGSTDGSTADTATDGGESTGPDATADDESTGADATATGERRVRITVTADGEERQLVTGADVATVGDVESARQGGYRVAVTLTDAGTEAFAAGLERVGAFDDPSAHELRTYLDGERLTAATLAPGLAAEIESGEWDGRFLVLVDDRAEAERVRAALAGE